MRTPNGMRMRLLQVLFICVVASPALCDEAFLNGQRLLLAQDRDPRYRWALVSGRSAETLRVLSAHDWNDWRKDAVALEVREPRVWKRMLHKAFAALAPTEARQGCVVDVLAREEIFIYRDGDGVLRCVPLMSKPAGIPVVCTYRFRDLLAAIAVPRAATLYRTGEVSYPFVFADARRVVFLMRDAPKPAKRKRRTFHLISSTVVGQFKSLVSQPVASLSRLFTTTAATATDVLKAEPTALMKKRAKLSVTQRKGMDLVEWEQALDVMTGSPSSRGRLRYLVDGVEFFPRFVDVALAAQRSIDVRIYIFDNDDYAVRVADFLRARSKSVRVRVLADGLGSAGAAMAHSPSLPAEHQPPRDIFAYLRRDSQVSARALTNPWLAGDHSKSIIVDERIAFVGGMNIGREYRYDWHDMMIEVRGPIVTAISNEFERTWVAAKQFSEFRRKSRPARSPLATADDYPVRLLFTRPGDSQIKRAQLAAIRRARSYVYIEPSYLTSDAVVYELVRARRRGVDVRVILPAKGDSAIVNKNHAVTMNALLKRGVRVYIYPGMSHLKAAVFDGWACLGSANMDHLSLRVNREMNIATSHPAAVRALIERVFEPDIARSFELTEPVPTGLWHLFAEFLADGL